MIHTSHVRGNPSTSLTNKGWKMKKSSLLSVVALSVGRRVPARRLFQRRRRHSPERGRRRRRGRDGDRACVILPDAASSADRWEDLDRKYLGEGLEAAGFEADIQNAQGDVSKYATIADQQLTQGCGVMLLVDLPGAGSSRGREGQGRGHPGDRLRPPDRGRRLLRVVRQRRGRPSARARPCVDGLAAAGKDPAIGRRRLHGRRPRGRQRRDVPRRRRGGHGGRGHQPGRRAPGDLGQARSRRPTSSRP